MTDNPPGNVIASYLAGEPVEEAALDAIRRSPTALDILADQVETEILLVGRAGAARGGLFAEEVRARIEMESSGGAFASAVRGRIEGRRRLARLGAAAAVLLLALGMWWGLAGRAPAARVVREVAAEWAKGPEADFRPSEAVELKSGLAELEAAGGVCLILEGPARVRFIDGRRVRLESGRLSARVPRGAEGFRVDTPSSEVVDLGTEFGVSVGGDGSSEVHVLSGTVQARRDGKDAFVRLTEGHGLRFAVAARQAEEIASDPARFVRALPGGSPDRPGFLHWTFDEGSGEAAADSGTGIGGRNYPARLRSDQGKEGPRRGPGRFGGALYFNGTDAFADTEFPGIGGSDPRTLAFWARVPADFERHQGYGMLSWGSLREPSGAWQISPNPEPADGPLGRLRVGTHHSFVIGSTDLRNDRWHHLAVVMYGGADARVGTHILLYLDGRLEPTTVKSIRPIDTDVWSPAARALHFARNLAFRDRPNPDRFFRGWLDEVHVFDAALSSEQIRSLMAANRLP
jgi:hypothetical protein